MTSASPRLPAGDPVDVATGACWRFATHLDLLAHQLGEASLEPGERQRLAAALEDVRRSVAKVTAVTQFDAGGAKLPFGTLGPEIIATGR